MGERMGVGTVGGGEGLLSVGASAGRGGGGGRVSAPRAVLVDEEDVSEEGEAGRSAAAAASAGYAEVFEPLVGRVSVVVRARGHGDDHDDAPWARADPVRHTVAVEGGVFKFEHVLSAGATQGEAFDCVGARAVPRLMAGYNYVCLAYGPRASGRTHTVWGTDPARRRGEEGVAPRLMRALLVKAAALRAQGVEVGLWVQHYALWRERVHDLLGTGQPPAAAPADGPPVHTVRHRVGCGPFVEGLREVRLGGDDDVEAFLRHRTGVRTAWDAEAARGEAPLPGHCHECLTVRVRVRLPEAEESLTSSLQVVDLAACEAHGAGEGEGKGEGKGNGEGEGEGEVMRERKSAGADEIALEHRGLREFEGLVEELSRSGWGMGGATSPHFRNSVLTFLLRESLSGNAATTLFCCADCRDVGSQNAALKCFRFAQAAGKLRTSEARNTPMRMGADSARPSLELTGPPDEELVSLRRRLMAARETLGEVLRGDGEAYGQDRTPLSQSLAPKFDSVAARGASVRADEAGEDGVVAAAAAAASAATTAAAAAAAAAEAERKLQDALHSLRDAEAREVANRAEADAYRSRLEAANARADALAEQLHSRGAMAAALEDAQGTGRPENRGEGFDGAEEGLLERLEGERSARKRAQEDLRKAGGEVEALRARMAGLEGEAAGLRNERADLRHEVAEAIDLRDALAKAEREKFALHEKLADAEVSAAAAIKAADDRAARVTALLDAASAEAESAKRELLESRAEAREPEGRAELQAELHRAKADLEAIAKERESAQKLKAASDERIRELERQILTRERDIHEGQLAAADAERRLLAAAEHKLQLLESNLQTIASGEKEALQREVSDANARAHAAEDEMERLRSEFEGSKGNAIAEGIARAQSSWELEREALDAKAAALGEKLNAVRCEADEARSAAEERESNLILQLEKANADIAGAIAASNRIALADRDEQQRLMRLLESAEATQHGRLAEMEARLKSVENDAVARISKVEADATSLQEMHAKLLDESAKANAAKIALEAKLEKISRESVEARAEVDSAHARTAESEATLKREATEREVLLSALRQRLEMAEKEKDALAAESENVWDVKAKALAAEAKLGEAERRAERAENLLHEEATMADSLKEELAGVKAELDAARAADESLPSALEEMTRFAHPGSRAVEAALSTLLARRDGVTLEGVHQAVRAGTLAAEIQMSTSTKSGSQPDKDAPSLNARPSYKAALLRGISGAVDTMCFVHGDAIKAAQGGGAEERTRAAQSCMDIAQPWLAASMEADVPAARVTPAKFKSPVGKVGKMGRSLASPSGKSSLGVVRLDGVGKLRALFAEMDTNRDGTVSVEEFQAALRNKDIAVALSKALMSDIATGASAGHQERVQPVSRLFSLLDENGDGRLTEDEFVNRILHPPTLPDAVEGGKALEERAANALTTLSEREMEVAELQKKISTASNILSERDANIAVMQKKISAATTSLSKRDATIAALQKKITEVEKVVSERDDSVAILRKEIAEVEKSLKRSISARDEALKDRKAAAEENEVIVKALEMEVSELKVRLESAEAEAREGSLGAEQLLERVLAAEERRDSDEERVQALEVSLADSKRELANHVALLRAADARAEALGRKLGDAETLIATERDAHATALSGLQGRLGNEMADRESEGTSELSALRDVVADLTAKLNDVQAELQAEKYAMDVAKHQLKSVTEEAAALKVQVRSAVDETAQSKAQLQARTDDATAAKGQLRSITEEAAALKAQLRTSLAEAAETKALVKSVQEKATGAEALVASMTEESKALKAQLSNSAMTDAKSLKVNPMSAAESDESNHRVRALAEEAEALKAQLKVLQEEAASSNAQMASLKTDMSSSTSQLRLVTAEATALKAKCRRLESELNDNGELKDTVGMSELRSRAEQAEAKLSAYERRLETDTGSLQRSISDVPGSLDRSWSFGREAIRIESQRREASLVNVIQKLKRDLADAEGERDAAGDVIRAAASDEIAVGSPSLVRGCETAFTTLLACNVVDVTALDLAVKSGMGLVSKEIELLVEARALDRGEASDAASALCSAVREAVEAIVAIYVTQVRAAQAQSAGERLPLIKAMIACVRPWLLAGASSNSHPPRPLKARSFRSISPEPTLPALKHSPGKRVLASTEDVYSVFTKMDRESSGVLTVGAMMERLQRDPNSLRYLRACAPEAAIGSPETSPWFPFFMVFDVNVEMPLTLKGLVERLNASQSPEPWSVNLARTLSSRGISQRTLLATEESDDEEEGDFHVQALLRLEESEARCKDAEAELLEARAILEKHAHLSVQPRGGGAMSFKSALAVLLLALALRRLGAADVIPSLLGLAEPT